MPHPNSDLPTTDVDQLCTALNNVICLDDDDDDTAGIPHPPVKSQPPPPFPTRIRRNPPQPRVGQPGGPRERPLLTGEGQRHGEIIDVDLEDEEQQRDARRGVDGELGGGRDAVGRGRSGEILSSLLDSDSTNSGRGRRYETSGEADSVGRERSREILSSLLDGGSTNSGRGTRYATSGEADSVGRERSREISSSLLDGGSTNSGRGRRYETSGRVDSVGRGRSREILSSLLDRECTISGGGRKGRGRKAATEHGDKMEEFKGADFWLGKDDTPFAMKREWAARRLLKMFDREVMEGKLLRGANGSERVSVGWSKRLTTTAGITRMRRLAGGERVARIELSEKVVDEPMRLYHTLAHELAHAAAWVFDEVVKPPHGPGFKKWAEDFRRWDATLVISTCHEYEIRYRYRYVCLGGCGLVYGRHSKSIDTAKKVCGKCRGRLELKKN